MKLKSLNNHLYTFLLKHKDFYLDNNRMNYPSSFPIELLDACIIIQWRYKKLNTTLKKFNISENELLFLDDNSMISAYGDPILPPIHIERNIAVIENSLFWFLYHELYGYDSEIRNSICDYIYLICINPLLIKNDKKLISLIIKIAKQIRKQRVRNLKLVCLKVINTKTNKSIFPIEEMLIRDLDKSKFPVNIYKGDITKLKNK